MCIVQIQDFLHFANLGFLSSDCKEEELVFMVQNVSFVFHKLWIVTMLQRIQNGENAILQQPNLSSQPKPKTKTIALLWNTKPINFIAFVQRVDYYF